MSAIQNGWLLILNGQCLRNDATTEGFASLMKYVENATTTTATKEKMKEKKERPPNLRARFSIGLFMQVVETV